MDALREALRKIEGDPELKAQFMAAIQAGMDATIEFFHSIGCEVTREDLNKVMNEMSQDSELSKEELQIISGGGKAGAKKFGNCVLSFLEGFVEGTHG